uniref:Uncharacterized protein n=1 Tax=viral metagenome TaxID=1070528 RepID=A0A6C0BM78_9ZZZZ
MKYGRYKAKTAFQLLKTKRTEIESIFTRYAALLQYYQSLIETQNVSN